MLKKNKTALFLSSAVTLLPILAGLLLWEQLPQQIATHWDISGEADGWSGRFTAVFLIPMILLAVHWLCILVTLRDPKNKGQNQKIFSLILCIIPLLSLYIGGIIYATAFGLPLDQERVMLLFIGALFLIIGNYLPKCRQNYTMGIKVPWALHNEENWNATHRFGGRVWVIGGMLILLTVFLPRTWIPWVLIVLLIPMAAAPVVYSWQYHKKHQK